MFYFDFEYRNNEVRNDIILVSYLNSNSGGECSTIDLRSEDGRKLWETVYKDNINEIWVAYNARADLTCMLTLGQCIRNLKVIDAMAEARLVTMTHPDYYTEESNLVATLKKLKIKCDLLAFDNHKEFKNSARNTILENETYTEEQWKRIEEYGPTDVYPLQPLLRKIATVHNEMRTGTLIEDMLHRGEYVKAVTELYYRSKGFPIDLERIEAIYERREEIYAALASKVNEQYEVYNDAGLPQLLYEYNKKTGKFVFKSEAFENLIKELKIDGWEKTESGKLSLKKDYLESKAKEYPVLMDLYRTRRTFQALNGKEDSDLRKLMVDGHIRPEPFTFNQKTGRNSPKPKRGFILNLTPWMRSALIHPHPGEAFIGIDWGQQEIAIAAILSGDKALKQVYLSGDPYLELAKMAGAVPKNATKQSHPTERQNFKAVQLGIGYGKGRKSLAIDVYEGNRSPDGAPGISKLKAEMIADDIFYWHKDHFRTYWDWVKDNMFYCERRGFLKVKGGWLMFWSDKTRQTQVQNFPMQAVGAEIMRRAVVNVYKTGRLDLICSLHDALYILSTEEKAQEDATLLRQCMDDASKSVLNGFAISCDAPDIYTHDKPYWDARGESQYKTIKAFLGNCMDHPKCA